MAAAKRLTSAHQMLASFCAAVGQSDMQQSPASHKRNVLIFSNLTEYLIACPQSGNAALLDSASSSQPSEAMLHAALCV